MHKYVAINLDLQIIAINNSDLQIIAINNSDLQIMAINNSDLQIMAINNSDLQIIAINNSDLQIITINNSKHINKVINRTIYGLREHIWTKRMREREGGGWGEVRERGT